MKNQAASVGELGFVWVCVLHLLIPLSSCSMPCLLYFPSLVDKHHPRLWLMCVRCVGTDNRLLYPRVGKILFSVFCTYPASNFHNTSQNFCLWDLFLPRPQLSKLLKTGQEVQRWLRKEGLMNAIQCDFVNLHFLRSKGKKVCSFNNKFLHLGRVHEGPLDIYLLGQQALGVFVKIFFPYSLFVFSIHSLK